MYCNRCGQQNPDNFMNCRGCGAPLGSSLQAAPGMPPPGIGPGPAPAGGRLALAIIVCILCCWPLAIPAIVYAAQAMSHNGQRNYAEAHEAAQKSMNWSLITIAITFLAVAGWFIFAFFMSSAPTYP